MKLKLTYLLTVTVCTLLAFAGSSIANAEEGSITYRIAITNLTKGQPLTPPVIAVHKGNLDLYTLGTTASTGLSELAKDGITATLVSELEVVDNVVNIIVGGGLILPGTTVEIDVIGQEDLSISLASMLAKTNDAFIGGKNIALRRINNKAISQLLSVYDAGAEENNEDCNYIPGCGNPEVDTLENEGFVHPHPGVYGIADLNVMTDAIASVGAKITITRMND